MSINIEKLNRLAYLNEERLRNAKNSDIATIKSCYEIRGTLAKIAKEAGFVRVFDNTFKLPSA